MPLVMIDYGKYWIREGRLVSAILNNPKIVRTATHNQNTGEVFEYPIYAKIGFGWELEFKSATWLEVTGSLHKLWDKGTNYSDFGYLSLAKAVKAVCAILEVSPADLTIHNLEFGVNVHPTRNATAILMDIVCYRNREAIKPIDPANGYFVEFRTTEYFLKLYDKGRQYNRLENIFRAEIKAMNSGFLEFAGVSTMADILDKKKLLLLGKKLANIFALVIFSDSTIDPQKLKAADWNVYVPLSNPKNWVKCRKGKNSTIKAREQRFKEIVGAFGELQHTKVLADLINRKWARLLKT